MFETVTIKTSEASKTASAGQSLAHSLYGVPLTVTLRGELGAGKTTFLQGFFSALGIQEYVTSPTYAIEQRYNASFRDTSNQTQKLEVLHLDLYRLNKKDAEDILAHSARHEGIRCIEWATEDTQADIALSIDERKDGGRDIHLEFLDLPLPTEEILSAWRNAASLPAHIETHCDVVANVAARLAEHLMKQGTIVRLEALTAAAKIHDLFRFLDFKSNQSHVTGSVTPAMEEAWVPWKKRFAGIRHEAAAGVFLKEEGYPGLGAIVAPHGLPSPTPPVTTEQKLLFYADKRVALDQIVTVEERFTEFAERYAQGKRSPESFDWEKRTKEVERELFPDGPPF
jgi:tRNA threonylcarbamoyl adenosine modification protein YjeE